ncbi:zinc finger and BTB domain-containing protein 24-like [Tigriopus californicus]|uniref:zinc finger and BTB domain-containing protein 24-like n=1 Tax=Tigriopus californicus TaxID=6832 RepID=UPI0027DA298E|nr:zinc finger and BTB domain-containing protein 24-like [Tigriopus californicus]XP_059097685.1 zinc finger and BTB domain-containing protein 24-like [Tigriopus californicus]
MADPADPQMYCLTWKTHSTVSGKKFYQHYQDNMYTDCQVSCGDHTMTCHRMVLSASSSFFERIFKQNQQTQRPLVILKDVNSDLFQYAIEYMYTGQVLVPSGLLQRFLQLATELRIEGLMDPTKDSEMEYPPSPKAMVYDNSPQEEPNHIIVDPQADETEENKKIAAAANSLVNLSPKNQMKGSNKPKGDQGSARNRKAFNPKRIRLENLCGALGSRPKSDSPGVNGREANSPGTDCSSEVRSVRSMSEADPHHFLGEDLRYRNPSGSSNGLVKDALTEQGELLLKLQNLNGGSKNGHFGKEPTSTVTSGAYSAMSNGLEPSIISKLLNEQMELLRKQSGTSSSSLTAALGAAMNLDLSKMVREHFLNNFPTDLSNQTAPAAAHGLPSLLQRQSPPLKKHRARNYPSGGKSKPSASIALDEHGNPILGPNGKTMVRCEDCGKLLADPSSLYRHRKIHTGDKPHTCDICNRVFIQRYNMKQHVKTHIGEHVDPIIIEGLEDDIRRVYLGLEGVADEDEVNRRLARKNKKRQQQEAKDILQRQRSDHHQLQYQQRVLQELQQSTSEMSPISQNELDGME